MVTPEVQPNQSLSLDDVQSMINYVLKRQAKSSDELMCRLIEEHDGKKLIDSTANPSSSSCVVTFAQTNPQISGTLVGGAIIPNPSAQLMNHFHNRTTINGPAPTFAMPQQTTTSTFGQGYVHVAPSFSILNPGLAPIYPQV
jgi:hypothetical protein